METIKTSTKHKSVLFVDGDRSITLPLTDYIENQELEGKYGLSIDIANNVKEALKILGEKKIDLVILDIVLPIVNGYFLLNLLKKENIPAVIYTNLKSTEDLSKLATEAVDNIFIKKITKVEQIVQMLIEKGSLKVDVDKVIANLTSEMKASSENGDESGHSKVLQCPKCKNVLSPHSHFCNNCGQKVFKKEKQIKIKQKTNRSYER